MKSVYIINGNSRSMAYGIGTYTLQLAEALKVVFQRVSIITLFDPSNKEINSETVDGIKKINIPPPMNHCKSSGDWQYYTRNVAFSLFPFIDIDDEEIVFHFNYMDMAALGVLLKKHFKCKIVLTVHYTLWSFGLLGDVSKLERVLTEPSDAKDKAMKRAFEEERHFMDEIADYIIAISEHSYQTICSYYGILSSKITIVPNGLKDSYPEYARRSESAIRNKYYIRDDEKILLFAGRVEQVKGVDYLLGAFGYMLEQAPSLRLFIVGEGDYLVNTLGKSNPYSSRVSFTGYIPQEQLFELHTIADIGIAPSLHEEFGYVVLEMMMMGLPIIVNESTGLKELVDNGVNGAYVQLPSSALPEEGTLKRFAAEVMNLLNNAELRNRYSRKAREKYLEKYSLGSFKKNMKEFYMKLKD